MAEKHRKAARPLESQKRAIVVGASSGVGAALVQELVKNGHHVAAVARREAKLAEVCAAANALGEENCLALAFPHNVTDFEETPGLFQTITRDLGGLDLIVYVAGIQPSVGLGEYNFEKDEAMIKTNLLGAIAWLNLAATRFERALSGHIVAVSSIAGDRGRVASPVYNSSKAGLNTYMEALRNRLARHGVTVTTVKPGFVDTVLLENAKKTFWVISPAKAARLIMKAITKKRQTAYIPARWALVSLVIRHIPSLIFRRLSI